MTKFIKDLSWSYLALVVLALSGFTITFLIAGAFGAEGLGVFSQAYAVYVVVSQVSAGGFHLAVFKFTAENVNNSDKVNAIVSSGLILGVLSGMLFSIVLFFLADSLGDVLQSDKTAESIKRLAPALLFFNLNKVLLSSLNAMRKMKEHSLSQIFRYLLLLLVVLWSVFVSDNIVDAAFGFLVSELFLLIYLVLITRRWILWSIFKIRYEELLSCCRFGVKGFWSGMIVELNVRTDVLLIGYFLSDKATGVYSFISIIFEWLLNVIYSLRINLNPALVTIVKNKDWQALKELARNVCKWIYPIAGILFVSVIVLYKPLVVFVFSDTAFVEGYSPLVILVFSITIVSGFIPFDQTLLQGGWPGYYSLTLVFAFTINVIFNLIMIPLFGLNGAALATGISLISGIMLFIYNSKKLLFLNLFKLFLTKKHIN